MRTSSLPFRDGLISGLRSTGCDVIDIGMVPTPIAYFSLHFLKPDGGVMITGSHNPPEFNGFKISHGLHSVYGERIQELRGLIANRDFESGLGQVSQKDIREDYIQTICESVNIPRSVKVVVDGGNGCFGIVGPELLKRTGVEVIELYCEPDGNFPNHHPDPSVAENLAPLIEAVLREQADLGLAFDGDGDRLGVVTDTGQVIWPDRQMILFARDILSRNPGAKIIYDVKCTRLLPEAVEQAGGEALMWKTGHSFIKAKLRETCGALGGEMSGHLFFKERWYGFDDALYAAARLCEVLSNDSRLPSAVFAEIPDTVNTPELRIEMQEGEHHALIKELVAHGDFFWW